MEPPRVNSAEMRGNFRGTRLAKKAGLASSTMLEGHGGRSSSRWPFDQILKKQLLGGASSSLVAIAAFSNAQGVTQLVGASLARGRQAARRRPPLAEGGRRPRGVVVPRDERRADPLAQPVRLGDRAAQRRRRSSRLGEAAAEEPRPSDPQNAPRLRRREGAHHRRVDRSRWSFAAFRRRRTTRAILRRRGGDVGGKTVKFVGWDRVWLTNGSQLCQAAMFKPPRARTAPPLGRRAAARRRPRAAAPARSIPRHRQGHPEGRARPSSTSIAASSTRSSKTRPTRCVRRASSPSRRTARWSASACSASGRTRSSACSGWRTAIASQTINGFDMASPEKALEAYARLRTADHLTVQVNRRGAEHEPRLQHQVNDAVTRRPPMDDETDVLRCEA